MNPLRSVVGSLFTLIPNCQHYYSELRSATSISSWNNKRIYSSFCRLNWQRSINKTRISVLAQPYHRRRSDLYRKLYACSIQALHTNPQSHSSAAPRLMPLRAMQRIHIRTLCKLPHGILADGRYDVLHAPRRGTCNPSQSISPFPPCHGSCRVLPYLDHIGVKCCVFQGKAVHKPFVE